MARLLLALTLSFAAATPAFAATYTVDSSHSHIGFSVTHMMVSTVRGSFGTVSGTVEYDPANIAATKVNATVGVASVDTRDGKRDDHLRAPDFFDAKKFPEMKFVSKSVRNVTDTTFDVVGDLTLRGVTKEVVLTATKLPEARKDPWGNVKTGTHVTGKINRKDFGVSWSANLDGGGVVVGDEVTIDLDVELAKK